MNALDRNAQALVEENYRFAYWVAGRIRAPLGFTQEEWVAECMFCMVRAANAFDATKGRFLSLVYKYVRTHRANLIERGKAKRRGYETKTTSIHDEAEGGGTFPDQVVAPESPDLVELRDLAEWAGNQLTDQERRILAGMAEGKTFTEIGQEFRLSKTTIANQAGKIQHRLAKAFPWETESAPRCEDCSGPVLTRTPAKYCAICIAARRSESMKAYDAKRWAARRNAKGAAV